MRVFFVAFLACDSEKTYKSESNSNSIYEHHEYVKEKAEELIENLPETVWEIPYSSTIKTIKDKDADNVIACINDVNETNANSAIRFEKEEENAKGLFVTSLEIAEGHTVLCEGEADCREISINEAEKTIEVYGLTNLIKEIYANKSSVVVSETDTGYLMSIEAQGPMVVLDEEYTHVTAFDVYVRFDTENNIQSFECKLSCVNSHKGEITSDGIIHLEISSEYY